MKKFTILSVISFLSFLLSGQVSQENADSLILDFFMEETSHYALYAMEDLQDGVVITTSSGEILKLDYYCWVYFAKYSKSTKHIGRGF